MGDNKRLALIERAKRELERRNADKQDSLFKYISEIYKKELKKDYNNGWVYQEIC